MLQALNPNIPLHACKHLASIDSWPTVFLQRKDKMTIYVVASCPFAVEQRALKAIAASPKKENIWWCTVKDIPNVVRFAHKQALSLDMASLHSPYNRQ